MTDLCCQYCSQLIPKFLFYLAFSVRSALGSTFLFIVLKKKLSFLAEDSVTPFHYGIQVVWKRNQMILNAFYIKGNNTCRYELSV